MRTLKSKVSGPDKRITDLSDALVKRQKAFLKQAIISTQNTASQILADLEKVSTQILDELKNLSTQISVVGK